MSVSVGAALEVLSNSGSLFADAFYGAAEDRDIRKVDLDPPKDEKAEAWLISAIIGKQYKTSDFPLGAKDFQVPFHRTLWVALQCVEGAELPMDQGRVCMALQALGNGPAHAHVDRVADLVAYAPFRIRENGEVARVLEMSHRRRLLRWARTFTAKVRAGSYTAEQAREHLRRVGREA